MRRAETEASIWWVAVASALATKGVDRAVEAMLPMPWSHPMFEGRAFVACERAAALRNDDEIADAWTEMQQPVCEPARDLLEKHLQPAPSRGQRRRAQFDIRISSNSHPAERAIYALQGFILLIGALLVVNALTPARTRRTLGSEANAWLVRLKGAAQIDEHLQLPFDTALLEEMLRAVAVLTMLGDDLSRCGDTIHPLTLEDPQIARRDDGRFIACGRLRNANDFRVPTAAVCVDHSDARGQYAGHLLVWPTALGVEANGHLDFYNALPNCEGVKPVRLRLATSLSDFWLPGQAETGLASHSQMFQLVDELAALLKRTP
jgi:hypothetical protein